MTSIELLPIFTADLGRHEEREDAGTANDIAQACRQEEAEEVIVQIRATHEDVISGFTRADDDVGKVTDRNEIGKGQMVKKAKLRDIGMIQTIAAMSIPAGIPRIMLSIASGAIM